MNKKTAALFTLALGAGFLAVAGEWTFEVEAHAPHVVSCKVGRDWLARMATNDVASVADDGTATPVPWTLDTTGNQPELVFLAAGHTHFTLLPRAGAAALVAAEWKEARAERAATAIERKGEMKCLQNCCSRESCPLFSPLPCSCWAGYGCTDTPE